MFCLCTGSIFGAVLEKRGIFYQFGTPELSIRINGRTGAWCRLSSGEKILADGARAYAFHLKAGEPGKIRHLKETRMVSIRQTDPDTLEVTVRASDGEKDSRTWLVRCFYKFEKKDSLIQSYELTCEGEGYEKARGFSQRSPYLKLSKDSRVMVPMQTGSLELYRPGDLNSGKCKESWGSFGLAQFSENTTLVMEGVYRPEHSEIPAVGTLEDDTGFQFGRDLRILGKVKAGNWEKLGDFRTFIRQGDLDATLRSLDRHLAETGVLPPEGRPQWLRSAVFYSMPINGSIAGAPYSRNGFREMLETNLPYVRALGCNLYHLLPVETGGMYCAVDYYKLHEKSGTPEDYRAFVKAAHKNGVRVFQDIVPHGGMIYPKWGSKEKSKRAVEMEHLTIIMENGKPRMNLIFDYDMPEWQNYMAGVAKHLMESYGLDGLRIDAVSNATGFNWRPGKTVRVGTSYCRGGGAIQNAIRTAARKVNQDAGVLSETSRQYHNSVSDVIYDFTMYCHVLPKIENAPAEKLGTFFSNFLHQQYFATPGHALFMHYVESHDTVGAEARWSLRSMRALFAVTIWSYGTPMVYDEGAHGSGEVFRKILRLRRDLPEMTQSAPEYLAPKVPGEVYTMLVCGKNAASVPLVNLSDRKLDFTLELDLSALPEGLRESKQIHDYWNSTVLPVEISGGKAAVKVTLPAYGMTLLRFEKEPSPLFSPIASVFSGKDAEAHVEKDTPVCGKAELQPEIRFLDPDGVIRQESKFFELVRKGDTMTLAFRPPYDKRKPFPEGGVLLRLPLEAKERCVWEAGSIHGVHQDEYRVRFPNSPSILTSARFHLPVDHNVLWSSLVDPFGFTARQAFINFRTAKGSLELTFDPASLPGHAAILDRVGKDKVPYLFIGFTAGRGTLKGAAAPSLSWKIDKASEHSAFDSGSGDERFTDHPGFWRYDDGKIRAEIGHSGMLRSVEVKEQDKWIPAAGALSLKLKNLWAGSKTVFSSAEVLESFRRIRKLEDGTIVFTVTAMPRVDLRRTFWGNDRIGEYVTEYRFHPDGTMELYAGLRCPGSEYAPKFSAELQWPGVDKNLCRIKVPGDWKKTGKGWMIFSSGIPVSKLGRWQWFSAAVGTNAAAAKLDPPGYCREFPFEYCLDGEFEQEGLTAIRQTVQNIKPFYDHIHMTAAPMKEVFTTSVGLGYFIAECENPHAGNYALGIVGKKGKNRFSLQPLRSVYFKPGSKWNFQGFLRGEKLQNGAVTVGTFQKGRFVPLAGTGKISGSFGWKQYDFQFRVPEHGKLFCRIENQGEGIIYADSFRFIPEKP